MNQNITALAGAPAFFDDGRGAAARKAATCPRPYHDSEGALQRCDGPMTFSVARRAWSCDWCGRVVLDCHLGR